MEISPKFEDENYPGSFRPKWSFVESVPGCTRRASDPPRPGLGSLCCRSGPAAICVPGVDFMNEFIFFSIFSRVARFFSVNITQTGKMYQMVIKYSICLYDIPNSRKIYQHFSILGPPKFTQIGIFGLKRNHLATPIFS
jgi:hypothetical protein